MAPTDFSAIRTISIFNCLPYKDCSVLRTRFVLLAFLVVLSARRCCIIYQVDSDPVLSFDLISLRVQGTRCIGTFYFEFFA